MKRDDSFHPEFNKLVWFTESRSLKLLIKGLAFGLTFG